MVLSCYRYRVIVWYVYMFVIYLSHKHYMTTKVPMSITCLMCTELGSFSL